MYNEHVIKKYLEILAELKATAPEAENLEQKRRRLKEDLRLLKNAYPKTIELIKEDFFDEALSLRVGLSGDFFDSSA